VVVLTPAAVVRSKGSVSDREVKVNWVSVLKMRRSEMAMLLESTRMTLRNVLQSLGHQGVRYAMGHDKFSFMGFFFSNLLYYLSLTTF